MSSPLVENMHQAACSGMELEVFFPPTYQPRDIAFAKVICDSCPIKLECFETAMENDYDGIWGGTTPRERWFLRRGLKPEAPRIIVSPKQKIVMQKNREQANRNRQISAAIEAQVKLQEALRILGDEVPADTRRLAEIRISNPELSLEEIGKMVIPPVTKDIVAGRLRRLPVIASKKQAQ